MRRAIKCFLALLGVILAAPSLTAAQSEKRIALVIGNAAYQQGALLTAANDAGLIAQTLQAAGFDVVGARDLDGDTLRHTLHDFIQKAASSGPDTVAMVYLAGYGLQVSGENYFLPAEPNMLVAYNAMPGTVGPNEPGPYGAYAQALAEMIRTGGLALPDVFDHLR